MLFHNDFDASAQLLNLGLHSRRVPRRPSALNRGPERLQIAFLGTTTVGKSTTINAILGRRLLPENRIGSTTAAKVVLRDGPDESLLVEYVSQEWLETEFRSLVVDWTEILEEERITGQPAEGDSTVSVERRRSVVRNALGKPGNYQLKIEDVVFANLSDDVRRRLGTKKEFKTDISKHLADHVALGGHPKPAIRGQLKTGHRG